MRSSQCPACGASIDFNASECKYCGEVIAGQAQYNQQAATQQPQQQAPQPQYQAPPKRNYSENRYNHLPSYYQAEFRNMDLSNGKYKGKWNWSAFFFSWAWAFSKGLWGAGAAGLVIMFILAGADATFLMLGVAIFSGIKGNHFYYHLLQTGEQFPKINNM